MTQAAKRLLDEFEALPEQERFEVLAELLQRTALAAHELADRRRVDCGRGSTVSGTRPSRAVSMNSPQRDEVWFKTIIQGIKQKPKMRVGLSERVNAMRKEGAMRRCVWLVAVVASLAAGCGPSVNVEQERNNLLALDREWSQTTKDTDKFLSYFAPDASAYPQGMPVATGAAAIRDAFTKMSSMPEFSIAWTPTKAEVSATGDLGYTAGTYEMTMTGASEKGKYVTVWKKQSGGEWKVMEDIFNADAPPQGPAAQHVMVAPSAVTWGDAPPSLPPGARMAVVSGDPTQAQPFVVRAQMPAGYRIAPHWHPTDEHITVLSGTVSLGMGEKFDQSAMKDLSSGGYIAMPAEMRHSFMAKTAATIQVHGMGPFAVNYVNPADDPSRQKK